MDGFSFPSLSAAQPSSEAQSNPFGISQPAPAAAQAAPATAQVQVQQHVNPRPLQPLTARSTVVHASSKAAAPEEGAPVQQQAAAAVHKPVPITQASSQS